MFPFSKSEITMAAKQVEELARRGVGIHHGGSFGSHPINVLAMVTQEGVLMGWDGMGSSSA